MSTESRPGRWTHLPVGEDGEQHPLEDILALVTLALGVLAIGALVLQWWDLAAWAALAGALLAASDEFFAKTSRERQVILSGFVLCLVAVLVAMANGALF